MLAADFGLPAVENEAILGLVLVYVRECNTANECRERRGKFICEALRAFGLDITAPLERKLG
jgi:hypothetical protein